MNHHRQGIIQGHVSHTPIVIDGVPRRTAYRLQDGEAGGDAFDIETSGTFRSLDQVIIVFPINLPLCLILET